jgi:hypothetical protein
MDLKCEFSAKYAPCNVPPHKARQTDLVVEDVLHVLSHLAITESYATWSAVSRRLGDRLEIPGRTWRRWWIRWKATPSFLFQTTYNFRHLQQNMKGMLEMRKRGEKIYPLATANVSHVLCKSVGLITVCGTI